MTRYQEAHPGDFRSYIDLLGWFRVDARQMLQWIRLRRLLLGRTDWHFQVPQEVDAEDRTPLPVWSFGQMGEWRLTIDPTSDGEGFGLYVARSDDVSYFGTIEDVADWLQEYESEHAGLSPTAEAIIEELLDKDLDRQVKAWAESFGDSPGESG